MSGCGPIPAPLAGGALATAIQQTETIFATLGGGPHVDVYVQLQPTAAGVPAALTTFRLYAVLGGIRTLAAIGFAIDGTAARVLSARGIVADSWEATAVAGPDRAPPAGESPISLGNSQQPFMWEAKVWSGDGGALVAVNERGLTRLAPEGAAISPRGDLLGRTLVAEAPSNAWWTASADFTDGTDIRLVHSVTAVDGHEDPVFERHLTDFSVLTTNAALLRFLREDGSGQIERIQCPAGVPVRFTRRIPARVQAGKGLLARWTGDPGTGWLDIAGVLTVQDYAAGT